MKKIHIINPEKSIQVKFYCGMIPKLVTAPAITEYGADILAKKNRELLCQRCVNGYNQYLYENGDREI